MLVLAWFLAVTAVVLGVSGVLKLVEPEPTARMLSALAWPHGAVVVRVIGVAEVAVAVAVVAGAGRAAIVVMAVLWAAFTGTLIQLRRRSPSTPCGCLGEWSGPPTLRHLAVNLGALVVTVIAGISATTTTALWDGSVATVSLGSVLVAAAALGVLAILADQATPGRQRQHLNARPNPQDQ
jgi:hypothetical protein